ncbi:hypothetical protein ACFYZ8_33375 [Streptomyces sp. NPDC001668]|uniref:hypothetical protein n=1 Tax=Streptomyces sp. NPDC001668 TaxID=3364598 RepID=UPI00367FBDF2
MSPTSGEVRFLVVCATVLASPGYREDRISIRRRGEADAFAFIALPHGIASIRDALAAFGWRLRGSLEYVAGPNEERGEVEPDQPAAGAAMEELREIVRSEILARMLALLADSRARHFQAVLPEGDDARVPVGWTFRNGLGPAVAYGWVTAKGRVNNVVGVPHRDEAAGTVRQWHASGTDAPSHSEPAREILREQSPADLARLLSTIRRGGMALEADGGCAARVFPAGALAPMKGRKLAAKRCRHHFYAHDDVAGDPVTACARRAPETRFGVFGSEGCVDSMDCAVAAANEAVRLNAEDDSSPADEPEYGWQALCREHEEQPAGDCEECATAEGEDEPDEFDDKDREKEAHRVRQG